VLVHTVSVQRNKTTIERELSKSQIQVTGIALKLEEICRYIAIFNDIRWLPIGAREQDTGSKFIGNGHKLFCGVA
jgi:hypothetical protein